MSSEGHNDSHSHEHHHEHDDGKDHFAHKSKDYDKEAARMMRTTAIADSIVKQISLGTSMHLMDFGAGTGLLTQNLAPHVGKITAVDTSPSMLEEFRSKDFECETAILDKDLVKDDSCLGGEKFDGVVSALTLHHIQDTSGLLAKVFQWTKSGGFIALADLDKEDGSFHAGHDHTGIFHHGFDRKELEKLVTEAGFQDIEFVTADKMKRDNGEFPIFLMTARKP